jgi:hypothetical protein
VQKGKTSQGNKKPNRKREKAIKTKTKKLKRKNN